MNNEFGDLEDKLKLLQPRLVSAALREKCLAALTDDAEKEDGRIGKVVVWVSYLRSLAACALLALILWSSYENYRLRQIAPPTQTPLRKSVACAYWRYGNKEINAVLIDDSTGTYKMLTGKSSSYWQQRQKIFH